MFSSAIGTKGETVLRVIIDQTGRLVTAFPADRIALIGLGAAGALALDEGTAEAGEQIRMDAEAQAAKLAEKEQGSGDWEEWIPFLGEHPGAGASTRARTSTCASSASTPTSSTTSSSGSSTPRAASSARRSARTCGT